MKKYEKQFHQDYHLPGEGKKTKQYTDSAILFALSVIALIIIISVIYFS